VGNRIAPPIVLNPQSVNNGPLAVIQQRYVMIADGADVYQPHVDRRYWGQ
jgi:hypothetical protein